MDSKLRAFFWEGSMIKRTIHWSKGSIFTKPKSEGDLGFKDFHSFNLALQAKQRWRLLQEGNQLWARLLNGIYFSNMTFLQASKGSTPSWIWSRLCESRTILRKGARMNLNNGSSIRIGVGPWIPNLPDFTTSSVNPSDLCAN
ncbi:Uncharacterized mitochondrial protein AtMg00310 [Linum perenne]